MDRKFAEHYNVSLLRWQVSYNEVSCGGNERSIQFL
jgi:hypothetical protein